MIWACILLLHCEESTTLTSLGIQNATENRAGPRDGGSSEEDET